MDRNQPITTYRCDLLNPPRKLMFPERSIRVRDSGKNLNVRVIRFWENGTYGTIYASPINPTIYSMISYCKHWVRGCRWAGSLEKT